jgi:hypothetical protein
LIDLHLYEINDAIAELLNRDLIDPETGEILDEDGFNALDELVLSRDVKIENTALFIKGLEADVKAMKEEEAALAKRRVAKEKKASWLKSYIELELLRGGLLSFETPKCKIGFRESKFVYIPDASKLAAKYKIKKVTSDPDKRMIKELIEQGVKVRGAELKTRRSLNIK